MTTTPAARAVAEGPAPDRQQPLLGRSRPTAAMSIVAATTAIVVACRLWVASRTVMPKGPDVLGPWAAAFHLAGSPVSIDMYDLPPYSVGMGAVLAPLVRVFDDPATRYQVAVALLGLTSLLAGWCIAYCCRRAIDADPLQQAIAFCVTSAITAVAFASTFSWAEPLVLGWLCAWLALAAWSLTSTRTWSPLMVALWGSTAPLVHGRVSLLPVIWCVAVLAIAVADRERSERRGAAGGVAAGVVVVTTLGLLLSQHLRSSVVAAVWSSPNLDNDTRILAHISEPAYWGAIALEAIGQVWYATASTFGLAPVGVVALAAAVRDRGRRSTAQRQLCALVLVGLCSVWAVGVLFVANALVAPGPERLDYLVYGRYGDPAVVVLAAFGAAWLVVATRRRAWAALGGAATLLVTTGAFVRWRLVGLDPAVQEVVESVVSGVASFPLDRPGLDLVRWSAISLAAIAVFALSRLGGRALLASAVAAVALLGGVAGSARAVEEHRAWDNSVLHRGYPAAPGGAVVVPVPAELLERRAYNFNMPSQQYALASLGWQLQVVDATSDEVRDSLTPEHLMVVLRNAAGAPGDDWCHLSVYDDLVVWARRAIVSGEPGGPCST